MDERTRDFLAGTLRGCQQLSKCQNPEAALISRGENILSSAYTIYPIPGKEIKSLPIIDSLVVFFKSTNILFMNDLFLFSTYFPNINELTMIHNAGIKNIYFFGEITDPECVKFFNAHTDYCTESGRKDLKFNVVRLY